MVHHFNRFGLSENDEEDIVMDDAIVIQHPLETNAREVSDIDEATLVEPNGVVISHSLPAHLGLDPIKMKEMRMVMFPVDEEKDHDFSGEFKQWKQFFNKEYIRPPLHYSARRMSHKSGSSVARKTPLALLEYNPDSVDSSSFGTILMA